jgi:hypothetical protein
VRQGDRRGLAGCVGPRRHEVGLRVDVSRAPATTDATLTEWADPAVAAAEVPAPTAAAAATGTALTERAWRAAACAARAAGGLCSAAAATNPVLAELAWGRGGA